MKTVIRVLFLLIYTVSALQSQGKTESIGSVRDSSSIKLLESFQEKIAVIEKQRIADSISKAELYAKLNSLKTNDKLEKEALKDQLRQLNEKDEKRIAQRKAQIDELRNSIKGWPVIGLNRDTLFLIYTKIGATKPQERAANISGRIKKLYEDDFLNLDSLTIEESDNTMDIVYRETIITSISETDALWNGQSKQALAEEFSKRIKETIQKAKENNNLSKILLRIALAILVIITLIALVWILNKVHGRIKNFLTNNKDRWLRNLEYKDYTFLTAEQELRLIYSLLNIVRWFVLIVVLYLFTSIIFSIFPFTRGWAGHLLGLVWSPVKLILIAIWKYLPNLFSIAIIVLVFKYLIRFVKYVFKEIECNNLKISGFHPDWALPTFTIVRFLLLAFMFVLIFPHLPGSDSNIFKGVSVFIGVLFSLGSSTAIANIVSGIVITYMRPFQIGDRIKIGDITGDVIEKTMLVTRIRTTKNEEITIPNSSVLSGNTTNYSSNAKNGNGLIIHTTVTIGYDVPWRDMHKALIDAALRTELVLTDPKPFVLQTGLEDFYVAYQLNAYIIESSKQAIIYSHLHQNIQDVCNERGIEILSPHYRAARDGNTITIPASYLPKDYQSPAFNVKITRPDEQ